jgi:hypothetical protein
LSSLSASRLASALLDEAEGLTHPLLRASGADRLAPGHTVVGVDAIGTPARIKLLLARSELHMAQWLTGIR